MKSDFEIIKKKYGENFARLCRSLFPTILEKEGLLPQILEKKFEPNRFLYQDIVENKLENQFKNFIFNCANFDNVKTKEINETPEELFEKAGYKLFKCETNGDVLSFIKYYKHGEELCTFRDPNRIKNYTIFWAVKKDVDKIKREDFTDPIRQDEYGTSVISLQFSKGTHSTVSIKNRYNHTVDNPDATFSNDLENIYHGLTDSFEKYYNIDLSLVKSAFEIPNYVMANDGKFYKYNCEVDNSYFCPNNIVIMDGNVKKYDKSQYEVIDYFLLDKKEPFFYVGIMRNDSFVDAFYGLKKIEIKKLENGERLFAFTNIKKQQFEIVVNKYNQIIKYTNNNITRIDDHFLNYNKNLEEFTANNVKYIGEKFLYMNKCLKTFNAEKVRKIDNDFLYENTDLSNFNAENLEYISSWSLTNNKQLEFLNLPNIKEIGAYFLADNNKLKEFSAKNLKYLGTGSLKFNNSLKKIDLPNLKTLPLTCLMENETLTYINLPKIEAIYGLSLNSINENIIEYINLDSLKEVKDKKLKLKLDRLIEKFKNKKENTTNNEFTL